MEPACVALSTADSGAPACAANSSETATPAIQAIRPSEVTTGSACRSDRGTLRSVKRSWSDLLPSEAERPHPVAVAPGPHGDRAAQRGRVEHREVGPIRRRHAGASSARTSQVPKRQRRAPPGSPPPARRSGPEVKRTCPCSALGLHPAAQLDHSALRLVDEPPDLGRPRSGRAAPARRPLARPAGEAPAGGSRGRSPPRASRPIAPAASAPDSARASAASRSSASPSSASSAWVSAIVASASGPISRSTGSTSLRIRLRA